MSREQQQHSEWRRPLQRKIKSSFGAKKASAIQQFAQQYYASTAEFELARLTDGEIFDSVVDAWEFLQQRAGQSAKIQFVQRTLDKDKKRQHGTSIYLLLDDMPFLVNSVRQCLARNGVIVRNVHNTVVHVERQSKAGAGKGKLKNIAPKSNPGHTAEAIS